MKIEQHDSKVMVKVLTAMIRSSAVLGRIASKWPVKGRGLFLSDAGNDMAQIVIDFYRKHEKAPKDIVTGLVEEWADGKPDERTEPVGKLLSQALNDRERIVVERALDMAGNQFNKDRLARLGQDLLQASETGQIDRGWAIHAERQRIELGSGSGVDLLTDEAAVRSFFSSEIREVVIEYPKGDARKFFGDKLSRSNFVCLMAPEKGLKSTWLTDLSYHALLCRKRVAFFDVGDSQEHEVGIKFAERIAKIPSRNEEGEWPCVVKVPTSIRHEWEMEYADVEWGKEKKFDKLLDADSAWEAIKKFMEVRLRTKESFLKISCHPAMTMTPAGIKSILQEWALGGWLCDVLVIDYMDTLAPPLGKMEVRDQINKTWMATRALSQEMKCLVLTGTQARRDAYGMARIGRKHIADDKRKLAHVTSMYSICMTEEEKAAGVCHLVEVDHRRGKSGKSLHCGTCLALSNPCVVSTMGERKEAK